MTYPISRHQTVSFTPGGYSEVARAAAEAAGEDTARFDSPPRYLVKVPTFMERAAFRRDLTATGARFHSDEDLLVVLRRQVAAALEPDDPEAERLLGIIDDYRAAPRGEAAPELREEVDRLEQVIRGASSEYAAMVAARAHWLEVAPIVACRHFLRGTENPDHVFARKNGLVSEADLGTLPEGEMMEVGYHIMSLMQPTKAQEKNSASPSS